MEYDPEKHHRRSIRLKDYDYSQVGAYFVTICTHDKKCLLGDVVDGVVELSPIGKTALKFWLEIPKHSENVRLDEFTVMPNHIHGIVTIQNIGIQGDNAAPRRGVLLNAPNTSRNYYSQISPRKNTLSVVVRTYKSALTRWCRHNNYAYFRWQRNYYEHVIRDEEDLNQIREYIINNPLKWDLDKDNPANFKPSK